MRVIFVSGPLPYRYRNKVIIFFFTSLQRLALLVCPRYRTYITGWYFFFHMLTRYTLIYIYIKFRQIGNVIDKKYSKKNEWKTYLLRIRIEYVRNWFVFFFYWFSFVVSQAHSHAHILLFQRLTCGSCCRKLCPKGLTEMDFCLYRSAVFTSSVKMIKFDRIDCNPIRNANFYDNPLRLFTHGLNIWSHFGFCEGREWNESCFFYMQVNGSIENAVFKIKKMKIKSLNRNHRLERALVKLTE